MEYSSACNMAIHNNATTIVVFHSYPNKPCVDGLMLAIIAVKLHQKNSIIMVPYWRTDECFQNVKKAVEANINHGETQVMYVDCSPDLPQEAEYLKSVLDKIRVDVFDHHPRKSDSPVNELIGLKNFAFTFDADNCAAKMMYSLLSEKDKKELNVDKLIDLIQYSEYDSMNSQLAGEKQAIEISQRTFERVMNSSTSSVNLIKNLQQIRNLKMELFYILDHVMAEENDWLFLNNESLNYQEKFEKFKKQSAIYIQECNTVISGENQNAYSENETSSYLNLLVRLSTKLAKEGKIMVNQEIGGIKAKVLCTPIDIFIYGRSLKPYLWNQMKLLDVDYAICMNLPTKNNKGELSYYLSLRRRDKHLDARHLARFVMDVTGSTIGGGHPWASGVTLNEEQYQTFLKVINF